MRTLFLAILIFFSSCSYGFSEESGLPIPRFVSLRSDEVNMRTGPGTRYPIDWTYLKRGLPVEIINEFETWRKIRDIAGDEGWIHQSMASGNRTALVIEETRPLYSESNNKSAIIAELEAGVILTLEECNTAWCLVETNGYRGWIQKKFLWGVYDYETF